MSLLTSSHINNISSLYLSSLLSWSQLPTLLQLNTERLTASYALLAESLRKWGIDFVTPTHGNFLFVRLAKNARSAEDEKRFYDGLSLKGVHVAQGRLFRGVDRSFGWARVRFSVDSEVMKVALARIESFLGQK